MSGMTEIIPLSVQTDPQSIADLARCCPPNADVAEFFVLAIMLSIPSDIICNILETAAADPDFIELMTRPIDKDTHDYDSQGSK